MQQTALAQLAGISPSYLNLIEHNRRAVAGRVLNALATALDIPPSTLAEDAESSLVGEMRNAAGLVGEPGLDVDTAEELIARFPEWAKLIASQARIQRDQAAAISTLNDRINFDPHLQETLYEMLTRIAAIRSSSNILVSDPDLSLPDRQQFQGAIETESAQLSEAAQEMVTYFDRSNSQEQAPATPEEAFEMFLSAHDHAFDALEGCEEPSVEIDALIAGSDLLVDNDARTRVRARLVEYAADAASMPLQDFNAAAKKCGYSPTALAQQFNASMFAVLRRLASLNRAGLEAPQFGLVIVNAAGQPLFRRPLKAFSLPRFTTICALWPAFQALSSPGQPLQDNLVMPDGQEFFARAYATPLTQVEFGSRPMMASAMLVTPLDQAHVFGMYDRQTAPARTEVGTSCRLCDRPACPVRTAPSLV